jgi:hypothetical protein
MERSPSWEADQSLQLVKKFPVFYVTRKFFTVLTSARHPSLSWTNSIHSPRTSSNFLNNHFNIILPSTPGSPQWPLFLRFPHQHPLHPFLLPHTRHMPSPFHSSRFKEYRSFSSLLCNFLNSPITSSLLGPNTLLNTLFSDTLSLHFSLNVSDQVSHPYQTTGRIIVLYILTILFSNFILYILQ